MIFYIFEIIVLNKIIVDSIIKIGDLYDMDLVRYNYNFNFIGIFNI